MVGVGKDYHTKGVLNWLRKMHKNGRLGVEIGGGSHVSGGARAGTGAV